jgi:hypothetical protein
MNLMKKNNAALLLSGLMLAVSIDVSAVPFYARQNRSALAQTSEGGGNNTLMADYTQDVQAGLTGFQFLSRNFAGANSGNGRPGVSVTGLIGPQPTTGGGDVPAPIPGSLALLGVGLSALVWSRRKYKQ